MNEHDPVRAYCRQQGYAEHVVCGGLDYLIGRWEFIVASITAGEPQMRYEYLNDMDTRQILAEAMSVATENQRRSVAERLARADAAFRESTILSGEFIWGQQNRAKHGWTLERNWWYFRQPKQGFS